MKTSSYIKVLLDTLNERKELHLGNSVRSDGNDRIYHSGKLDESSDLIKLVEEHLRIIGD